MCNLIHFKVILELLKMADFLSIWLSFTFNIVWARDPYKSPILNQIVMLKYLIFFCTKLHYLAMLFTFPKFSLSFTFFMFFLLCLYHVPKYKKYCNPKLNIQAMIMFKSNRSSKILTGAPIDHIWCFSRLHTHIYFMSWLIIK